MRFCSYYSKLCKQILFNPLFGSYKNMHYFRCDQNVVVNRFRILIPNYNLNSQEFHISTPLNVKSHQEKENEYAHNVMESRPAYTGTVVKIPIEPLKCSSESLQELVKFSQVTIQCVSQIFNLEDKQFSLMVSNIVKVLPMLTDDELIQCLHLLCCWPPTRKTWTPNFKAIWNNIDYECVKRLKSWNIQQKLLVADYWFQLRLSRISLYNKSMIKVVMQNLDQLSNTNMIQFMFYVNLQREIRPSYLEALEKRLLSTIEEITMEELGIICLGFFKTSNKINDFSIIKSIIEKFLSEIESAEQVTIVAVLKFLKKSMQLSYTESYIPLLHKCVRCIDNWDVQTAIHSALLASECHVYHPLLLNSVIDKVTCDIKNARLKDCMKLLQCLAHFNHPPTTEFNVALFTEFQKEKRKIELSEYPRDLIYSALYYAYMGHFNYDLLNIVLNSEFMTRCTTLFPESDIAFAEVDCCVEIECKDYNGNRLGKNYWKVLHRRRSQTTLKPNKKISSSRLSIEVMDSLEAILGNKDNFLQKHILPHIFLPDIIIQLYGNPKSLLSSKEYLIMPPKDELWVCCILGVPFSFAYRSKHITGITAMKLRQIKKLGYKTIFIPYYELPRDSAQRKKFLKLKLEALQCNEYNLNINLK